MSEELKNKEVVDGKIVEEQNVDGAQQGTPEGNPAPAPQPQGTQNDGDKPKETFFGKLKKTAKKVWEHPTTQAAVKVGTTTLKVGGVILAVIGGVGVAKAIHDSKQTSEPVPEETTLTEEPDVSEESSDYEQEQEEPKEEFHDVTDDVVYYDDVYTTSDGSEEESTQE